jgi:CheY-like chemotaxis protein
MSGLRGIAISGFGMNGDIEKSLQAGFSEHLVKPIKIEKLEAAIDRVIGAETVSS